MIVAGISHKSLGMKRAAATSLFKEMFKKTGYHKRSGGTKRMDFKSLFIMENFQTYRNRIMYPSTVTNLWTISLCPHLFPYYLF
jgi:hypothetical protein